MPTKRDILLTLADCFPKMPRDQREAMAERMMEKYKKAQEHTNGLLIKETLKRVN